MLLPHLWPDTARIADGQLLIGGCRLSDLAAAHGTPLYLFDEATLRGAMRGYMAAFARHYPGQFQVHYASKALLNTAVAQIVAQEGLGLDVVSGAELLVARRAGVPMDRVHLHGNAKSDAELRRALEWGVGAIVVDNLDELARLAALSADREEPQGVLLRLAPNIDAHTHAHIATGGAGSKFGLPLGLLNTAAELTLDAPGLRLLGVHAHIGSQLFAVGELQAAVGVLVEMAAQLHERYGAPIVEISPGGGLGVPYTADMPATDIDAYAQALSSAMVAHCETRKLPLPHLTVEPGRSIVARAGVALYRVVGRKIGATGPHPLSPSPATQERGDPPQRGAAMRPPDVQPPSPSPQYLHIDGGMADNIRPALYGARYTALLANRADAPPAGPVDVAGRYCESGDVLLRGAELPAAAPGDLLAVAVSGAYTLSMASTYNMVPRPAVLLVADGQARLIQRRETEEDLLGRDVGI